MNEKEVVKIPEVNKRLGSCPECGHAIWESDIIYDSKYNDNYTRYCCIECRAISKRDEIIPF